MHGGQGWAGSRHLVLTRERDAITAVTSLHRFASYLPVTITAIIDYPYAPHPGPALSPSPSAPPPPERNPQERCTRLSLRCGRKRRLLRWKRLWFCMREIHTSSARQVGTRPRALLSVDECLKGEAQNEMSARDCPRTRTCTGSFLHAQTRMIWR